MRLRQRHLRAYPMTDFQGDDTGQVIYHASVFGVEDSYETIFDKGCFAKTINDRRDPPNVPINDFLRNAPGGFFPMVWFHMPWQPIGLSRVSEDDTGLLVHGQIDLGREDARDVLSGMRSGYINCASHSFDVVGEEKHDGKTHYTEVGLFETSPLTMNFASNPEALVDLVRAALVARFGYVASGMEESTIPPVRTEDLQAMVVMLRSLREGGMTETEESLLLQCSDALQSIIMPEQGRPYPNEHACRLQPPSKFSDFRRGTRKSDGKAYSVIFGKVKDEETWEEQAYRYAKDVWDADDARTHCKSHDGKFEAASGEDARSCALADMSPEPTPTITLPGLQEDVLRVLAAAPLFAGAGTTTPGRGPHSQHGVPDAFHALCRAMAPSR